MVESDTPVFTVSVSANPVTDPPTLSCSPNPVPVTARNALLVFDLVTPGYVFIVEDAIVVQNPGEEFPNFYYVSPTQVAMRDRCLTTQDYAYTVTVEEQQSGRRLSHDPTIRNNET